ncbi:Arabinanase/levansucrase/invertase [Violaceomyces palustris]|uniref:Arabinanase/levansucrase/invertase n=1 Tax=Violaceomyces palustris TaxID=1673888 RepID=A0ACD0P7U2_9BASI|nr:Arabinanase/levansucrase/invertase [Violaceomyces palustris]
MGISFLEPSFFPLQKPIFQNRAWKRTVFLLLSPFSIHVPSRTKAEEAGTMMMGVNEASKLILLGLSVLPSLVSTRPLDGFNPRSDGASPSYEPNFQLPPINNVSHYSNGSLWYQWRPKAHFIHPSNQLGDPTAFWMGEDGKLHLTALYSFIRGSGNDSLFTSSFAGSTTYDLLRFEDDNSYQNPIQIGAGNEVDFIADFDGSVIPKGYKGLPTLIWTAVKGLPISWSIPYNDGYESQALAYSEDDGKTWIKLNGGKDDPVIRLPPYLGNVVTGFRDPWVMQNKQIDEILSVNGTWQHEERPWYISISGGIHGDGPRLFFYRQSEPDNFTSWDYLGPILQEKVNTSFVEPGTFWAGSDSSDGSNYETSQLTNLGYEGDDEDGLALITMGAESGRTTHSKHWSLYRMGHWAKNPENESVVLETTMEGLVDPGMGYACTGTSNVTDHRRYTLCWIPEDFTNQDATKYTQEYLGSLTLPRELFVKDIENVVDSPIVRTRGSWAVKTGHLKTARVDDQGGKVGASQDGLVNLTTLGIRPAKELEAFRSEAEVSHHENKTFKIDADHLVESKAEGSQVETDPSGKIQKLYIPFERSPSSRHWEMETTISFPNASLRNQDFGDFSAGISILRSSDGTKPGSEDFEEVSVVYRPANESIIIYRDTALSKASVNTDPEIGKVRLWERRDEQGRDKVEDLKMRIFLDGSALEVYVNDVLAISTRAYYWFQDSLRMGYVYNLPTDLPSSSVLEETKVEFKKSSWWQGLVDAYPGRPKEKEKLIRKLKGYPQPENNPNQQGIIYEGTGQVPEFPKYP